jgi:hypothetical protein
MRKSEISNLSFHLETLNKRRPNYFDGKKKKIGVKISGEYQLNQLFPLKESTK